MVLGGMRKKEINTEKSKVPLLGDIPIIKGLFKFEAEESVFSELIVFITPMIVVNEGLSEDEQSAYEHTQFDPPCTVESKAEVDGECVTPCD